LFIGQYFFPSCNVLAIKLVNEINGSDEKEYAVNYYYNIAGLLSVHFFLQKEYATA
jgi:hypothetical protein